MEPEGSLPYSQVPATRPYPEPTPSSPPKKKKLNLSSKNWRHVYFILEMKTYVNHQFSRQQDYCHAELISPNLTPCVQNEHIKTYFKQLVTQDGKPAINRAGVSFPALTKRLHSIHKISNFNTNCTKKNRLCSVSRTTTSKITKGKLHIYF
jgi:hypothetical protein